jgi:hypothetical protein
MKRAGNLWDQITSLDNIVAAHHAARRGKAHYSEVKMVDKDPEGYARTIQAMLLDRSFTTSAYEIEERQERAKVRTIYKLPYFPDRIVQHALLQVIGPILVRSFIRDTFQSIQGRGTSDAMRRVRELVRRDKPRYALKIDVRKYYPSVDNERLKAEVRRKIKCPDTLWLVDDIIDSMPGLPIGNYTSQHFGNLYLSRFDWWMVQQVRPAGYFRYCDDILVFGNDRIELLSIRKRMVQRLGELGLQVKPTWQVYDVARQGADFVGYVFRPESTRLRPSIARRFKAACRSLRGCMQFRLIEAARSGLMAYKGWVKPANAKRLWRTHAMPLVKFFPKQLRAPL